MIRRAGQQAHASLNLDQQTDVCSLKWTRASNRPLHTSLIRYIKGESEFTFTFKDKYLNPLWAEWTIVHKQTHFHVFLPFFLSPCIQRYQSRFSGSDSFSRYAKHLILKFLVPSGRNRSWFSTTSLCINIVKLRLFLLHL